ncbi:hypothetical protein BZA05DRAFT_407568 [Tricharina praecox]|uniref:uncharacterized protein n=1 Tax=Tricharina praecox TaxID=43433 RepID=UPI00221F372C|nr:uncharacterized protein BZA05DRAFT_407568 [Tricharina praecox]KAI5845986.1 hypothetical protein BZA05DRAFT_407568 [Tricharina praecox]
MVFSFLSFFPFSFFLFPFFFRTAPAHLWVRYALKTRWAPSPPTCQFRVRRHRHHLTRGRDTLPSAVPGCYCCCSCRETKQRAVGSKSSREFFVLQSCNDTRTLQQPPLPVYPSISNQRTNNDVPTDTYRTGGGEGVRATLCGSLQFLVASQSAIQPSSGQPAIQP